MQESDADLIGDGAFTLPAERGECRGARSALDVSMNFAGRAIRLLLLAVCGLTFIASTVGDDSKVNDKTQARKADASHRPLHKSTWSYPHYTEARKSVIEAIDALKLPLPQSQAALRGWPDSEIGPSPDHWLDALADSFHIALPAFREVIDRARDPREGLAIPDFGPIDAEAVTPFVKNHLQLLAGRWLAQHGYYDEALEQFSDLDPNSLIDPATLLFHSAAAHHQLLHKEECLTAVSKLLENEPVLPSRYRSLAHLMQADFQPLEADSLDETSRLMESVERRLGLAHAGKRVRAEEDAVVAKLDKLIEDLEKQRDEQQKQQQAGASSTQPPTKPMQDSQAAGGKGPGNVDPKKTQSLGAWGNIPPKQRQEALQQLSRDLPAHYREVVEEYFRKLASEEKAPK
jgi:hypothetical protein